MGPPCPPHAPPPSAGTNSSNVFTVYEKEDKLGEGVTGEVMVARHKETGVRYVWKRRAWTKNAGRERREKREREGTLSCRVCVVCCGVGI